MTKHPDPAAVAALLALAERATPGRRKLESPESCGRGWQIAQVGNSFLLETVALKCDEVATDEADGLFLEAASPEAVSELARSWLQMRAALEDIRAVLRAPNTISPAIADMLAQTAEAALAGRAGE